MIDFVRSVGAIALVFGLVVFIHELGHFIAAKLMGVYAPRFSIGFGSALISRKWGETEYMIAAVPLGGYVRMASKDDETMAFIEGGAEQPVAEGDAKKPRYWDPNGMAPFGPKPVPPDRWFESKSFLARLFILVAGVTMNVVLGFVLFTGLAKAEGRPILLTRVVGGVNAPASMPQLASLQPGDSLLAVGARSVANWNEFAAAVESLPGDTLVLRTQRGVVSVPVGPPLDSTRGQLLLAIDYFIPPVIDDVVPGQPAQRAGLDGGDSITTVNGRSVSSWREVVTQIESSPGKQLNMDVMRGGKPVSLVMRPDSTVKHRGVPVRDTVVGQIGALALTPTSQIPLGWGGAIEQGAALTWNAGGLVLRTLRQLATGGALFKELGGPIAIGGAAAHAAKRGWADLVTLLGLLSINLAVFNLLPVPLLDGGQIVVLAAEQVKGGALSMRTKEYLMRAGLAFILLLLAVVMFNDIPRLFRMFMKQ